MTLIAARNRCGPGEIVDFRCHLRDASGNALAGRKIAFSWTNSGLPDSDRVAGAETRVTDQFGGCTLMWFSQWMALTGRVTATITADFTGDASHAAASVSEDLWITSHDGTMHVRLFKDSNGNGHWDAGIDRLIPNVTLTISSSYNEWTRKVTSTTGEYAVHLLPQCAYDLSAIFVENGTRCQIERSIDASSFSIARNTPEVDVGLAYPQPRPKISGNVYWNGGTQEPAAGVEVELYSLRGTLVFSTTTSRDGRFVIHDIPLEQSFLALFTGTHPSGRALRRLERVSVGSALEVPSVVDLHYSDWLRAYAQAERCLEGTLNPSLQCLDSSMLKFMSEVPGGCAVSSVEDLCSFIDDLILRVAGAGDLGQATTSADDVLSSVTSCILFNVCAGIGDDDPACSEIRAAVQRILDLPGIQRLFMSCLYE